MKTRTIKTGIVAGVIMLALPFCAIAADSTAQQTADKVDRAAQKTADTVDRAAQKTADKIDKTVKDVRSDVRDMRDDAAKSAGLTQEERDKATMERIESKEDKQTWGEYAGDAEVTAKVKGKFVGQKGLDSLDIKVVTVDGSVTLLGDVDNAAQIGLAEKVAREVEGVRQVDNQLVVKKD